MRVFMCLAMLDEKRSWRIVTLQYGHDVSGAGMCRPTVNSRIKEETNGDDVVVDADVDVDVDVDVVVL